MTQLPWNIPVLPVDERDRRYAAIRQAMKKQGLDCLVVAGHQGNYGDKAGGFRYVANYVPWYDDEYVVFPRQGEPVLLTWSAPHAEWAKRVSWISRVDPAGGMSVGPTGKRGYIDGIPQYVQDMGCARGRIGICDFESMPAYVYVGIREALSEAEFVDCRAMLSQIRMIKSPLELDFMQKAAECGDIGIKAMVEAAKPGTTDSTVFAACEYAMTVAGATPPSFTLIAACPSLREKGIGIPYGGTGRVLQRGDIILNELTPSYGGYFIQALAPIVLGSIPDELRGMADTHREMYELALAEIRPGTTMAAIHEKLRDVAVSRGCDPSPAWALAHIGLLVRDDIPPETVLQPNMTFVVHPFTQYDNGAYGGHTIGSTVVVTETGCRVLNRTEMDIHVAM